MCTSCFSIWLKQIELKILPTDSTVKDFSDFLVKEGDKYKCPECDYTSLRVSSLQAHAKIAHKNFQIKIKTKKKPKKSFVKKSSGGVSLKSHRGKKMKRIHSHFCPQCDYTTTRSTYLLSHIDRVHRKLKPYQCPECSYATADNSNLKTHINAVHKKIRRYQCPECDYGTYGAILLKRHCETVHMKLKPHGCPDCDYMAASTFHLKRHIISIHLKLKPYKCPKCEDTFTRHAYLRKHYEVVHNEPLPANLIDPNPFILKGIELNPSISDEAKVLITQNKRIKSAKVRRRGIIVAKKVVKKKPHQCTQCDYAAAKVNLDFLIYLPHFVNLSAFL